VTLLESKMMIREERIWCQKFFKPGVWGFDFVGGTDFIRSTTRPPSRSRSSTASRPRWPAATGKMPNTLVLGANVAAGPALEPRYRRPGQVHAARRREPRRARRSVRGRERQGRPQRFTTRRPRARTTTSSSSPTERDVAGLHRADADARRPDRHCAVRLGRPLSGHERDGRRDHPRPRRPRSSDWIQDSNAFDYRQVSVDLGMFFQNANQPTSA
jgi:hypothetical protein